MRVLSRRLPCSAYETAPKIPPRPLPHRSALTTLNLHDHRHLSHRQHHHQHHPHARAMPLLPSDKLLVHLPGPPPDGWLAAMAARFPRLPVRWEVATLDPAASDLARADDALPAEALADVTLLCVYPPTRHARSIPRVRFVQLVSAGSDRWVGHDVYEDPGVAFCSGSGCQPPQMAEWVMGAWLSHEHHFSTYADQQARGVWSARIADRPVTDSMGRRMGILGYGAIGRQVAHLARALGMTVHAYTSRPRPTPESRRHDGYSVPGTGDPDGVIPARWFDGPVDAFLASGLDVVVVGVPLNDATRGLIGRDQLRLLSDSAPGRRKPFLVNVARGPVVDTDALIEALEQGLISGAALDVTDPEPLPKDHPLWKAPNVFITPHISWQSTTMVARVAGLLMENLERLDKGEPLINQIHK